MEAKSLLEEYKKRVEFYLESYFRKKKTQNKSVSPFVYDFTATLEEFTMRGGKRLRPALMYYAYKIFSQESEEEVIQLSSFIELIQSFLLIHDDIMDNALLRRGADTVHTTYRKVGKERGYKFPEHFGTTMAILSGDLAMQYALEIINQSSLGKDKINLTTDLLGRYIEEVIFGQVHDVLLSYEEEFDETDIFRVHDLKTATYTYKLPMEIGARLGGATKEELNVILSYAEPAGIAFQIRDDILGAFGNDVSTGKESKSDFAEGKKTFLILKALEMADKGEKEVITKLNGKSNITDEESAQLREIIVRTGSLEYSEKLCIDFSEKAIENISKMKNKQKSNKEAVDFLVDLADYLTKRNK